MKLLTHILIILHFLFLSEVLKADTDFYEKNGGYLYAPTYCDPAGRMAMNECLHANRLMAEEYFLRVLSCYASEPSEYHSIKDEVIDTVFNKCRKRQHGGGTMGRTKMLVCLYDSLDKEAERIKTKLDFNSKEKSEQGLSTCEAY